MSLLPILLADNPIIRQKSKRIKGIDNQLQKLIEDMIDTMDGNHGVGLAAPQVGALRRVIVIRLPKENESEEENDPIVLINPEVVKKDGERNVEEGCLSIPGWRGEVTRSFTVTVKGLNRDGKPLRINKVTGLLAQALEHEIDHLNGVLFVDHLVSPDRLWKYPKAEEEGEEEIVEVAEAKGGL
ncbi:MAG: peptide deformylase [Dehalococcoidia bacterium]|nr:peptide deformylase [Dehalococcoidia bacterium]